MFILQGIVPPSREETDEDKVLKGVVRVEMVQNPSDYIPTILARVKREYMVRTYKVNDWITCEDFLEKVAQKSGKLLKGGEPDFNTVAKMVLNDWQRGKIPFFVPPPGCEMPPPPPPPSTETTNPEATNPEATIPETTEPETQDPEEVETKASKSRTDQDFSMIRMSHRFDEAGDLDLETGNSTFDVSTFDVSQNDDSMADTSQDDSKIVESEEDDEEVEELTPKKRKNSPKKKSKSAKKVKTASGVFEVFDVKS